MRREKPPPSSKIPVGESRVASTEQCGCLCLFEPCWNIPGLFYEGLSLTEDIDSGTFPFTVRMASIRPILFSGLFCFVLLSWINREGLIHFSRKTGCTKILQVTMKQTCSRTIIFRKGPNNTCSGHLHGVAVPPSPISTALSPWPSCLFLWVSVSSDGKSGPVTPSQKACCEEWSITCWEHWAHSGHSDKI